MTRPRILLHVGYHKTATSFLQQHYFGDEANGFVRWPAIPTDVNRMFTSIGPFGEVAERDVEAAYRAAEEAERNGRVLVISHERLSGHPSSGGFDAELILQRLTRAFPEARVLITIREQISMILSVYGQYVREGGALPIKRYLAPVQPELHRVPSFDPRFFQYSRLIDSYQRSFGRESVLVLPFELFKEDQQDFTRQIAAHAGTVDWVAKTGQRRASTVVNRGDGAAALRILRVLNGPIVRSQFSPAGLTSRHRVRLGLIEVSRTLARLAPSPLGRKLGARDRRLVEQATAGLYEADNHRVAAMAEVDLGRFEYLGTTPV